MKYCLMFDLDGTLVDSRQDLANSINFVRKFYDLPELTLEEVTSYVGNGVSKLIERSFRNSDVDLKEAEQEMKKYYSQNLLENTKCYSGVKTTLAELANANCAIAVITNKLIAPTKRILAGLNIAEYVDIVIGGDSNFPLKPEPDALLKVMNEFSATLKNSFMIGDNYTDLEAARRAGIRSIFASYGFGDIGKEKYSMKIDCFPEIVEKLI